MATNTAGDVIGVGRLHRLDDHRVQIRYMAIAEESRGQGVGKALLKALERQACEWGATEIVLNARSAVKDFYLAQGYEELAPGETLFGKIAHVKMCKVF